MQSIAKIIVGSKLHGLNTKSSDTDLIHVFIPSIEDFLTRRYSDSFSVTNNEENLESKHFSIHQYIGMLLGGDTNALDALFSSKGNWVDHSYIWLELHENRHRFLSKNMRSMIGYARGQASKYSVKASRLETLHKVLEKLKEAGEEDKIASIANSFSGLEHVVMGIGDGGVRYVEVCGRQLQFTADVKQYIKTIESALIAYGHRTHLNQSKNKGTDWKAMSHALRVLSVYERILEYGTFSYPLPNTALLMAVKLGKIEADVVSKMLDEKLDRIEKLQNESELPETPDYDYANTFILNTMSEYAIKELVGRKGD